MFLVAFIANAVREGWGAEPQARWWQKAVNVKVREWTWIDWALLTGFLISLVVAGGWGVLWRRGA
jgi:hypothetical protein